jgi:hypothetical protein
MYVWEHFTMGLNRINNQEKWRFKALAKEYDLYIF